jgi:hypothetical protein
MIDITYLIENNYLSPSFMKIYKFYEKDLYDNILSDTWCIYENNIIFLPIGKCASTSFVNCFEKIDGKTIAGDISESDIMKCKDIKFYAITRNPEDRYISALNYFINLYSQENNLHLIENNLAREKFIFDAHTLPQYYFISNVIKHHNITLLKLDKNINEKLSDILKNKITLPILNSHSKQKNNYKIFCKELFEKYCKNNKNYINLYKKDFEMYDNAI